MSYFQIRLKILRENKGLSQKDLANVLQIAQSTVGGWEAGKREPNYNMTKKIANYFKVSVDYLIGATDDQTQYIHSRQPVTILCCCYQITPSMLKSICGDAIDNVELWTYGYHRLSNNLEENGPNMELYPEGDMAERLSLFFNIPYEKLIKGFIPLYESDQVWGKVAQMKKRPSNIEDGLDSEGLQLSANEVAFIQNLHKVKANQQPLALSQCRAVVQEVLNSQGFETTPEGAVPPGSDL